MDRNAYDEYTSNNISASDSGDTKPKQRGYRKVFSKFADMTSMSGVGYIKNTKLTIAKMIWSILLVLAFAALTVHLWFSLSQFYSYPKTAKISLGYANLKLPEVTICNVNPVSKRRLDAYSSYSAADLKRLVWALEPQTLAPEQFNDSLTYEEIAELYSSDASVDYYEDFWSSYDSSAFYANYPSYDYYNNYDYNPYSGSGSDYYGSDDDSGAGYSSGEGGYSGSDDNSDTGSGEGSGSGENTDSSGSGVNKRRRKRYAQLFDAFNVTEFDPTFNDWFRHESTLTYSNDEYRGEIDSTTKIEALFRKTYMSLARWERSRLGHNMTKMLLKCTFAGRVCDENKKLFRLHQTPEYGNCWTLSSRKFLSQTAGPKGGLTIVLNLQSTDYLEGLTAGYGARVQIHNRGTYPDPYQDGFSIPASMETSIGLKLVSFERLSGNFGDCEDGDEFREKYKRPYTRRTCQIFCHASLVIDRCGCFDETSEEVAVITMQDETISACRSVTEYQCVNSVLNEIDDKTITCNCRNPCKESTYVKSISNHQWPSDQHAKLLLAGICAVDTEACKSFLNENNTVSRVANNFLKLNIYFEDLNFEEIKEEPDIEIAQILSDVGGAVGLWIGLSVISFCEVIQLIIELINMTRHKMSRDRAERKNTNKRKYNDSVKRDQSQKYDNGNGTGREFSNLNRQISDRYSPFNPFNYPPVYNGGGYPFPGHSRQPKRPRY